MEAFPININTVEKFTRLTRLLGEIKTQAPLHADRLSSAIIEYAQTHDLPESLSEEFPGADSGLRALLDIHNQGEIPI